MEKTAVKLTPKGVALCSDGFTWLKLSSATQRYLDPPQAGHACRSAANQYLKREANNGYDGTHC